LHKDPVSREHHPNSQVSDVTEFPAPTERADVRVDFNRLIRLWRTGRLDLEGMIRKRVGLRDINQAFADMKSGDVIRTVVEI
jgi:threonine dehydrogenase-like Zn-dependent dehydrogenase